LIKKLWSKILNFGIDFFEDRLHEANNTHNVRSSEIYTFEFLVGNNILYLEGYLCSRCGTMIFPSKRMKENDNKCTCDVFDKRLNSNKIIEKTKKHLLELQRSVK